MSTQSSVMKLDTPSMTQLASLAGEFYRAALAHHFNKSADIPQNICAMYRFLQSTNGRSHPSVASVALDRALSRGRNYTGRILNFGKSGDPLWNQLSIVPIRNKLTLEVTHFVGLSTFTKADAPVEEPTSLAPLIARGSSHQCLLNLEQESSMRLIPQRSSSYMVLSALTSGDAGTLELVSN